MSRLAFGHFGTFFQNLSYIMKAEKFEKIIINNCFGSFGKVKDSDYKLLKALCFYMERKTCFICEVKTKKVYIMGEYFRYDTIKNFFDKLGLCYELVGEGFFLFKNFHISENSYNRIKPFLKAIRNHFFERYDYCVTFDKDGEVISMTNDEVNIERLSLSIEIIASNGLSVSE